MPDDLTVQDPAGNTLEGWESEFGQDEFPIVVGNRKAQLWQRMPSAFFNWVMRILIGRLNRHDEVFRERALWNDVDSFFWQEETATERPPAWGMRNNFAGFVFRKNVSFDEAVYWAARNKYTDAEVQLAISAQTQNTGGVMFSVGVAEDFDGPYTVYSPENPLAFNPAAPQPQVLTIPCGTLAAGKTYYYRLVREYDHQGDTLDADVVVAGVKVR